MPWVNGQWVATDPFGVEENRALNSPFATNGQAYTNQSDTSSNPADLLGSMQGGNPWTPVVDQTVAAQGYNPAQYASQAQAQALNTMLGGQGVVNTLTANAPGINVPPQANIDFGGGTALNAGLLANRYAKYDRATADAMTRAEMMSSGGGVRPGENPQFASPLAGGAAQFGGEKFLQPDGTKPGLPRTEPLAPFPPPGRGQTPTPTPSPGLSPTPGGGGNTIPGGFTPTPQPGGFTGFGPRPTGQFNPGSFNLGGSNPAMNYLSQLQGLSPLGMYGGFNPQFNQGQNPLANLTPGSNPMSSVALMLNRIQQLRGGMSSRAGFNTQTRPFMNRSLSNTRGLYGGY